MKVAIVIVGHMRTWLNCKSNFIESFNHLNPDVFVSTYDVQYNYHPAQSHWMGGTADAFLKSDEILSWFTDINLVKLDVEHLNDVVGEYNLIRRELHPNFQNDMNTVLQYRKLNRVLKLMMQSEDSGKYDIVIKIRSDVHHKKFDYVIKDNSLIVSAGNVFPNDVIFAAYRDNFVNLVDFIVSEFKNPRYVDSHVRAPHNLLLRACEYCKLDINKVESMEYVIRKTGNHYYNNIS